MKENTGNYRLCKQIIGQGGTKEVLVESSNKNEILEKRNEFSKDAEFEHYCEEEVIYKGTLLDENKKPINSQPSWIRI